MWFRRETSVAKVLQLYFGVITGTFCVWLSAVMILIPLNQESFLVGNFCDGYRLGYCEMQ